MMRPQSGAARAGSFPRGILYAASGGRHTAEMIHSARSVRRHMAAIPIVAYTDQEALPGSLFTEVRPLVNPRHSFMDKIAPLRQTPFERTVFLDTDTYICSPLDDLFDLLDRVDLAVSHAPLRHDRPSGMPDCFCELNTGVVAYRHTPEVSDVFADWQRRYEAEVRATGKMDSDQPAFREAVWHSRVSLFVLPQEYNLRTVMPAAVGRYRIRIIHGRAKDMQALARTVNASRSIRLFTPDVLHLTTRNFRVLSPGGSLLCALLDIFLNPVLAAERHLRTAKRRILGTNKS